jgi:hypothetical protein
LVSNSSVELTRQEAADVETTTPAGHRQRLEQLSFRTGSYATRYRVIHRIGGGFGDMGNWFNSLSSKKAGSCCSNFDGRPSPEAIVQTSDNHYQVMLEGQWIDVPDDAVLDVPNK